MPRPRTSKAAWLTVFLILAAAAGCEKDEKKIRLVIDSELPSPEVVDAVEVRIAASETDEGSICAPAARTFSGPDFPVIVYYVVGPRFDAWFAARVSFSKEGSAIYVRDVIRPITDVTTQEIRITFESACRDLDCPAGQQCEAGVCADTYAPSVFDDPAIEVDTAVTCD